MAIRKFDYARENKYVGETFSSTSFDGTIDEFPDYSTQIMLFYDTGLRTHKFTIPAILVTH